MIYYTNKDREWWKDNWIDYITILEGEKLKYLNAWLNGAEIEYSCNKTYWGPVQGHEFLYKICWFRINSDKVKVKRFI